MFTIASEGSRIEAEGAISIYGNLDEVGSLGNRFEYMRAR